MYKIFYDNELIFDLNNDIELISPVLKLQDNNAGTLDFSILPDNIMYNKIRKMKSEIKVVSGKKIIFAGRPIDEIVDFKNCKKVTCEGALAYLNDSVQRPAEYHNLTIRAYLETLINYHNQQVSDHRLQFKIGIVTVHDDNDSIYKYTNWETTLQVIKTDLVDKYGGHLRVRIEGDTKYLDYLKDYPRTNTQMIEFGTNLLDFTTNIDATQIATAVIPLGARQEESSIKKLEERLTIKSVNNNLDYVVSESAVNTYGWIFKTVIWDDVHKPIILKHKGEEYLKNIQFENVVLKVKAIDLHMVNVNIEQIELLDEIRVVSKPNGLDKVFPVSELTIDMTNPLANTITLGNTGVQAMSGSAMSNNTEILKKIEDIPSFDKVVDEAIKNTTELINNALNGHVVKRKDELLIMDTADIETAKKVWRWNLNGLAYSNNGYTGPYETAITMDGSIVANRITTGILKGGFIKFDLTRGTFLIGQNDQDFLLKFDGEKLQFGNGTLSKDALEKELLDALKGKDGKNFKYNLVTHGDFSRSFGLKKLNNWENTLYNLWTTVTTNEDVELIENYSHLFLKKDCKVRQRFYLKEKKRYYLRLQTNGKVQITVYECDKEERSISSVIYQTVESSNWISSDFSFNAIYSNSHHYRIDLTAQSEYAYVRSVLLLDEELNTDDIWYPSIHDSLGVQGEPGTLAELPDSLLSWAGKAVEIGGQYVYTPELFVGTHLSSKYKTGIYIGKNVNVQFNGTWQNLSGLMGLVNGEVKWIFTDGGDLRIGTKWGETISLGADGRAIIPEITTDKLLPGSHERIVMERGYSAGENNCKSIDANYDGIRMKANSGTYYNARKSETLEMMVGGILGMSIKKESWNETHPANSNISNWGDNVIRAVNSRLQAGWVLTVGISSLSDISKKENVKFLDSDFVYRQNTNHEITNISVEEIQAFIKNARIATYNFKGFNIDNISVIAQSILSNFKNVSKYLIHKTDNTYSINQYAYISMIHVAIQENMKKIEELEKENILKDKKIEELEDRLKKLENTILAK